MKEQELINKIEQILRDSTDWSRNDEGGETEEYSPYNGAINVVNYLKENNLIKENLLV